MDGIIAAGTSWLPVAGALLLTLACTAGIRAGIRSAANRRLHGARTARPTTAKPATARLPPALPGNSPASEPSAPGNRAGRSGIPATLGRYRLVEEIGAGAMGQVFLGLDPKINRKVAIKAVYLADACDPDDVEDTTQRFMREAEAAGRLNHPNIVTIYDVGEERGVAYIAMEYLEGKRLSDFTRREALLPPAPRCWNC